MGSFLSIKKSNNNDINKNNIKLENRKKASHAICFGFIDETKSNEVQKVLINAFLACKIIKEEEIISLSQIKWITAINSANCVNASSQIASFNIKYQDIIINEVRKNIPEDAKIWLFDEVLTNNPFNARRSNDGFHFSYIVPKSILFLDEDENKNYTNIINKLNKDILPEFCGNHNFHNYTKEKPFERYMFSIKITPYKFENDDEYLIFDFFGRTFGRSQVQRMMTIIISYINGAISLDEIRFSFSSEIWKIRKCPNYCMFLDKVNYNFYMTRMKKPFPNLEDVEFTKSSHIIEKWKKDVLFPYIISKIYSDNFHEKIKNVTLINPPKFITTEYIYVPRKLPE